MVRVQWSKDQKLNQLHKLPYMPAVEFGFCFHDISDSEFSRSSQRYTELATLRLNLQNIIRQCYEMRKVYNKCMIKHDLQKIVRRSYCKS